MRGVFRMYYDEPESAKEGGRVFKIYDIRSRPKGEGGGCSRYMINRSRRMMGVFEIYYDILMSRSRPMGDEPESPHAGACSRCMLNRNREIICF